jgi:hypothetical protein
VWGLAAELHGPCPLPWWTQADDAGKARERRSPGATPCGGFIGLDMSAIARIAASHEASADEGWRFGIQPARQAAAPICSARAAGLWRALRG